MCPTPCSSTVVYATNFPSRESVGCIEFLSVAIRVGAGCGGAFGFRRRASAVIPAARTRVAAAIILVDMGHDAVRSGIPGGAAGDVAEEAIPVTGATNR